MDDNTHLIQCIVEYQQKGKAHECFAYQQTLHRNLVYLAQAAEVNPNLGNLLPPPQISGPPIGGPPTQGPPMSNGQPQMQQQHPSQGPPPQHHQQHYPGHQGPIPPGSQGHPPPGHQGMDHQNGYRFLNNPYMQRQNYR